MVSTTVYAQTWFHSSAEGRPWLRSAVTSRRNHPAAASTSEPLDRGRVRLEPPLA